MAPVALSSVMSLRHAFYVPSAHAEPTARSTLDPLAQPIVSIQAPEQHIGASMTQIAAGTPNTACSRRPAPPRSPFPAEPSRAAPLRSCQTRTALSTQARNRTQGAKRGCGNCDGRPPSAGAGNEVETRASKRGEPAPTLAEASERHRTRDRSPATPVDRPSSWPSARGSGRWSSMALRRNGTSVPSRSR